jgi:hypothetical protein
MPFCAKCSYDNIFTIFFGELFTSNTSNELLTTARVLAISSQEDPHVSFYENGADNEL